MGGAERTPGRTWELAGLCAASMHRAPLEVPRVCVCTERKAAIPGLSLGPRPPKCPPPPGQRTEARGEDWPWDPECGQGWRSPRVPLSPSLLALPPQSPPRPFSFPAPVSVREASREDGYSACLGRPLPQHVGTHGCAGPWTHGHPLSQAAALSMPTAILEGATGVLWVLLPAPLWGSPPAP